MLGYAQQAQGAGQSAAELPADIIGRLMSLGFTSLCYDGQYFFDTDHPVGDNVASNKGTKTVCRVLCCRTGFLRCRTHCDEGIQG
jgi:phage major head subunit gpT-like protein